VGAKARLIGSFFAFTALLGIVAVGSILVCRLSARLVVPVTATIMIVVVYEFISRFNTSRENPTVASRSFQPGDADKKPVGIKVLRILIIGLGCIFALNVVTFGVEAWRGTLEVDDLRRFVPKALFALALAGYVLQKMRTKTRF
jgi:hypothetical protein